MNTKTGLFVERVWMVLPLFLFTFLPLTTAAQTTFTERLQQKKPNQGTITIHQDKEIDELVNGPQVKMAKPDNNVAPVVPAKPDPIQKKAEHDNRKANEQTEKPKKTNEQTAKSVTNETDGQQEPDGQKKLLRNAYKVNGYRVQAFAGGNSRTDRQKAEQTGNNIKVLFPDVPVYVHFYSPRWICRVGNYRTYEEAHQMLSELRKLGYKQASIVKGKITVQY